MKILLWAPFGAGEHYWGPGISAYRLYKSGLPSDIKVYLAHSFKNQKKYSNVFEDQYFIKGLTGKSKIGQLLFLWNSYRWIQQNYKKFDVIHVLGAHEIEFRPALWFEKKGIPCICKLTSDNAGIKGSSFSSRLLGIAQKRQKQLNCISGYIAISNEITNNLNEALVDTHRIFRISNGVDIGRFKPTSLNKKKELRNELGISDLFTVLFVGGISKRKQPQLLVNAVRNLIVNNKLPVQLILLGPDRDYHELNAIKNIIKSNSLENQIIHIDNSNEPEKYYQASDVFCLPSKSEGMSNALLEAMSCGLPVLVTPISGSVDLVIDSVNGFYIKNLFELEKKILELIEDDDLKLVLGRKGRYLIEEKFSSHEILRQHINLYKSLIIANK